MLHVFPAFTMYASKKWYFSTVSTCDLGIEMCFRLEASFLVEIVARVVGMKISVSITAQNAFVLFRPCPSTSRGTAAAVEE